VALVHVAADFRVGRQDMVAGSRAGWNAALDNLMRECGGSS